VSDSESAFNEFATISSYVRTAVTSTGLATYSADCSPTDSANFALVLHAVGLSDLGSGGLAALDRKSFTLPARQAAVQDRNIFVAESL
jgi:hypothetical protein